MTFTGSNISIVTTSYSISDADAFELNTVLRRLRSYYYYYYYENHINSLMIGKILNYLNARVRLEK